MSAPSGTSRTYEESLIERTEAHSVHHDQKLSSHQDVTYLGEQGKRQQFKRNFGFMSMLGFTTTMLATWEAIYFVNSYALLNGGPVGLFYNFIFCFVGSLATTASMAEMASMAPTSGGQYHWVASLAPPKHHKFFSWITGWLSVLGWQAFTASGAYLCATVLQGIIVFSHPSYVPERYQSTLIVFAVLLLCVSVNTIGARALPKIESLILILHVLGFFAILIPLARLAPHSSASFVFTQFENQNGWPSDGTSWFIGLLSGVFPFLGYDGPCHMAEEVQDAATVVPWCMVTTIILNGILGLGCVVGFLFCIGDMKAALNSETGYDFIEVFYNATQSKAGTTAMASILLAMAMFATFGLLASASRQTWAFARDRGLPFSAALSKVNDRPALPLHAIAFSAVVNALLALIIIGSSTAFNAIVSLAIAGLFVSYLIPITLLLLKKLQRKQIRYGPWHLGRPVGILVNATSIIYLVITTLFSFFPPELPVNRVNMNYSSVVFGGVSLLGIGFYVVRGRHVYTGPIVERGIMVEDLKSNP